MSAASMAVRVEGLRSGDDGDVLRTLFAVAWFATLAAIVVEVVLIGVIIAVDAKSSLAGIAADFAQKVSWSLIVCAGITLGSVVTRVRGQFIGLAGLFAAPTAFFTAKTAHKAAAQSLGLAQLAPDVVDPLLAAMLKAVEYALLGAVLAWIAERGRRSLGAHVLVGAAFGTAFAALVVALVHAAAPAAPPMATIVIRGANELIAPVACSVVVFAANVLGRRPA